MLLPLAFQLALLADLTLRIVAALLGIEHGLLVASQIAESGLLMLAAAVLHEAARMLRDAMQHLRRWWRRRQSASPHPLRPTCDPTPTPTYTAITLADGGGRRYVDVHG
jgi:hypothetical protein